MSAGRFLDRFTHSLYRSLDLLIGILLLLLLVEVCAIILTRQVGLSWVWLYDVARWNLAWLVFFGAVPLTGRGDHLTVDVATAALPRQVRWGGRILAALTTICFAGLVLYYGGLEVVRMYNFNERSMSGSLPAFLGYSVLPLAFSLLMIAGIGCLRKAVSEVHRRM